MSNNQHRALIARLEQERLANTPSGRYRREQDLSRPASMQRGSDKLPLFWIAWFVVFGLLAVYFGSGV